MLVKICGLTRRSDAETAIAAGADLLGFIFVPGTPRAVTVAGAPWIRELRGAATVGVFRDADLEQITEVRRALDLDRVQLHGGEPDAWLTALGPGVIRRVPVGPEGVDPQRVRSVHDLGALPLLDPGAGDGRPWDWAGAGAQLGGVPFGLAGGLGPDCVAAAVAACRPALVDVSSGVESAPGRKDHEAVRTFVAAARAAVV